MTTAIEVTKREMYRLQKEMLNDPYLDCFKSQHYRLDDKKFRRFEAALEAHLEALRQDRANLVTECDTLRNRVQVLEMANATSGDVIRSLKQEVTSLKHEASQARKNLMAARLADLAASVSVPPYNASGATLDGKTGTILGAVVDCQRIVTDWSLKTIKAKEAMYLISSAVHDPVVKSAVKAFEQPKCDHFTESGEGGMCRKCGEMVFGKDTVWVWTKPHCMHSFHPAFPSGELCTFCGVGK